MRFVTWGKMVYCFTNASQAAAEAEAVERVQLRGGCPTHWGPMTFNAYHAADVTVPIL